MARKVRTTPPVSDRLRIRALRRSDVKDVARLARSLNRHQGDPESRHISAALTRDALQFRQHVSVLVATISDRIVGYGLYTPAYETSYATRGLYLNDIYVVPRERRRGVGRAILAAIAREGSRKGATFMWWASRPWNHDAHRFYAALGARMEPIFAHALTHDAFAALVSLRPSTAQRNKQPRRALRYEPREAAQSMASRARKMNARKLR